MAPKTIDYKKRAFGLPFIEPGWSAESSISLVFGGSV